MNANFVCCMYKNFYNFIKRLINIATFTRQFRFEVTGSVHFCQTLNALLIKKTAWLRHCRLGRWRFVWTLELDGDDPGCGPAVVHIVATAYVHTIGGAIKAACTEVVYRHIQKQRGRQNNGDSFRTKSHSGVPRALPVGGVCLPQERLRFVAPVSSISDLQWTSATRHRRFRRSLWRTPPWTKTTCIMLSDDVAAACWTRSSRKTDNLQRTVRY